MQNFRNQEEKWLEDLIEERKEEARERRKQNNKEHKAAMNIQVAPNHEKELCDYEKLRTQNI